MSVFIMRAMSGLLAIASLAVFCHAAATPLADVHMHYKWSQQETTAPEEAIAILERNGIELAVIIGTPPELVQQLRRLDPQRVLAWYGPYQTRADWYRWYQQPEVLERAEAALESGDYVGIGELHLIGGFAPKWDTPVIDGLLKLSAKYKAPLLVHVEFGRADYLIGLCQRHPGARLLLAHAGAPMRPGEVRRALEACPSLWWELSARDPWRYSASVIFDEQKGALKPGWRELIIDFSDRLMLGSDPVWPVEQLDSWDTPDTGWNEIGRFWSAHERWLKQLPEEVANAIRYGNAMHFFGRADVDGPEP
jgi:predicted TIM-barrel fold metal-dependent hydrolase